MSHVTVTWMDGPQENYPAERVSSEDGELHILLRRRSPTGKRERIHIPLVNVRTWLEEQ